MTNIENGALVPTKTIMHKKDGRNRKYPDLIQLKEDLGYDYEKGLLYNKTNRGQSKAGKYHTYIHPTDGYVRVYYNKKSYSAHVLIWMIVYNEPRPTMIDHINGIASDNRLCNLRLSNPSHNLQNQRTTKRKSYSTIPGVIYEKRHDTYRIRLMIDGIYRSFGMYKNVEDAETECIRLRRIYYAGNTL